MTDIDKLKQAVQFNCDLADAVHAQDYTLCIYLLKMREYYRWEKGLPLESDPPRSELSDWITAREARWEEIEAEPFAALPWRDSQFEPFEVSAINRELVPKGYVYSGGYANRLSPTFFLGRLLREEQHGRFRVLVIDQEIARDMAAVPGMLLGETIFIRRDAIRRFIHERWEEWLWHKHEGALAKAFQSHGFGFDDRSALESMTDAEVQVVALHEIGEALAGEILGEGWNDMLLQLGRSRAEFVARAVRDHMADCLSTLPSLLESENLPSLAFYAGNLAGIRRQIFPELAAALGEWQHHGDLGPVANAVERGRERWSGLARDILHECRQAGSACQQAIEHRTNTLF